VIARSAGVEEEYGEAEVLVDEIIEENDSSRASEVERQDLSRDRDATLAHSGRPAREIAMRRQAPINIEAGLELTAGSENDDEEFTLQNERSDGKFSFPASSRSPTMATGDIEAEFLILCERHRRKSRNKFSTGWNWRNDVLSQRKKEMPGEKSLMKKP
jgi:hypothetical protein